MRNRSLVIAFTLCALAFSLSAAAAGQIENCSTKQTLVFANGVWNKKAEWEKSLRETGKFFKSQQRLFSKSINFAHPSEDSGQDMLEVFLMKSREPAYNKLPVEVKMAIYVGITTKELEQWWSLDTAATELSQDLRTNWLKLVEEHSAESLSRLATKNIDAAVAADYAKAKKELLAGRRLLVVAHSQGNLYSNLAIRKLFADQKLSSLTNNIKMVGIAVPAESVTSSDGARSFSTSDYVTRDDDGVINRLREKSSLVGAAAPLPANVAGAAYTDIAGLGHRYLDGYLQEVSSTGPVVRQKLINAYDFLQNQDPTNRVAFEMTMNFEFPQTSASIKALDDYWILGDDVVQGENGVYASANVSRPTPNTVAVRSKYFCRTLDHLPIDQTWSLPIGVDLPSSVPPPVNLAVVVESMGMSSIAKSGAPLSMAMGSTGSRYYFQGLLQWRKHISGGTLTSQE